MTEPASVENPFAGQGSVLLDIGGDIGALVVTTPAEMEGVEVEIKPLGSAFHDAEDHDHGDDHEHSHGRAHHPHVAVVNRPVEGGTVPSLVYPELVEGRYELYLKGTTDVRLTVEVTGGEVTSAVWPH